MRFRAQSLYQSTLFVMAAALAVSAAPIAAQHHCNHNGVGVIVDRGRANTDPLLAKAPFAHVFDPDTLQITASVELPLPPFAGVFDVVITEDLDKAYISCSDDSTIWIIDLSANPPALASGINPIQLNAFASADDLALTPDGRYLLAASNNWLNEGGSNMSVIDLRTRVETSYYPFNPSSPTAVDVAPDGSVVVGELVTSTSNTGSSRVRRFRIDRNGVLVDTGDVADVNTVPAVQNLLVPSYPQLPHFLDRLLARHTIYVGRPGYGTMGTLRTNGLRPVDTETLANPTGIDLCFDPYRSMVYVRTNELGANGGAGVGNSRIDGYPYSALTGRFGALAMTVSLERRAGTAFGVEQTAVDGRSRRLFVSGLAAGEVRVFDSVTGAAVGAITGPSLTWALGIAVRRR